MKIALLTSVLSPAAGGLAASVPGMVRALAPFDDLDVHVLGTRDRAAPDAWRAWGASVHPLDRYGPGPFQFAPALGRTIDRIAPALIDVQGLWTYPSLASLRQARRRRRIHGVTPHGMLDPWALRRSRWKKRLVETWFERAHLSSARFLRATAPMEARHFRNYGLRQPIAIIPNGVAIPTLEPRAPASSRPRRLLFLSRIHPKKGLPILLTAWAELQRRHPDWELVIAGPDEVGHQRAMQKLAAALELTRVSWPGPAFGSAKDVLYRSADLFVLPTHAENFGQVVAEALAYAVPVVTTRNAPWSGLETSGCGLWVELGLGPLTEALDTAMSLPDQDRHAMGLRGRAWMEREFGWDAVGAKLHALYGWALGGGPPPPFVETADRISG